MPAIFFTGFPGFLGAELLPRLLRRQPDAIARCLVQPKFAALARERAGAMTDLSHRIEIVEGDITSPITARGDDVTEVHHLAAVYDLMVPRETGMLVNVAGTRNVLDFAARCPALTRFHYVSTCYVSGRYPGLFRESDLVMGQRFNNYYEETKYLAEIAVQERMRDGLPATIYRPSVTVGDSRSGATQKYDGPYFVMQWLMRQPRVAILPVAGDPARFFFNVVPRDFIVDAIDTIAAQPDSRGKVFQLADPDPLTVDETIDAIAEVLGKRVVRIPIARGLAKALLDYVPGVHRLMRIPSAAVDYFVHPATYDTTNTLHALAGTGESVPRFREYLPKLIEFARQNPGVSAKAMV